MWDNIHKQNYTGEIITDDFLDNYNEIINEIKGIILDIGCGLGNNTKYLKDLKKNVIAIDNSVYALEVVKQKTNAKILFHDITQKFPYNDESIDLIIADLSLHYFDNQETIKIIKELKRILKKDHSMLIRVNSIYDTEHGAQQGVKIEENYYLTQGYKKRFFTEQDIKKYFKEFKTIEINLEEMKRYKKNKIIYRIKVTK